MWQLYLLSLVTCKHPSRLLSLVHKQSTLWGQVNTTCSFMQPQVASCSFMYNVYAASCAASFTTFPTTEEGLYISEAPTSLHGTIDVFPYLVQQSSTTVPLIYPSVLVIISGNSFSISVIAGLDLGNTYFPSTHSQIPTSLHRLYLLAIGTHSLHVVST